MWQIEEMKSLQKQRIHKFKSHPLRPDYKQASEPLHLLIAPHSCDTFVVV